MNNVQRLTHLLLIMFVVSFAAVHLVHISADFPHHSPWQDWAKYTDEGWYGNAATRAHLFGSWYLPGDFNPISTVPVWPFILWIFFHLTGVTLEAARSLAVLCFLLDVLLSYALLRARGPRWAGLLVVAMLVTNPYLYCFSRLAILEPLLITFTLLAMNLAIRLPRFRRQRLTSAFIGLLFAGMVLTKTTALFLLPALVSVFVVQFRHEGRRLIGLLIVAGAAAAFALSLWVLAVASNGLYLDFAYFFSVNDYPKPKGMWENLESLWLTCRGITQPDRIFIAVPALLVLATVVVRIRSFNMPRNWADELWRDPVFFGSIFAIGGYIAFMTYQNHPQPRYYVVIAFFSFCLLAQITSHILNPSDNTTSIVARRLGKAVLATALITIAVNGIRTLNYVMHPQYTWVTAATNLTSYIDQHPNGNRLLLATSGDEITLITHVPALCDIWGTEKLSIKLARYQPGWYATWDRLDPRILEEIHTGFAVKQVASFPAFDDPGHSVLYLFQLHPLPPSEFRNEGLPGVMPGDVISIPVI